MLKTALAGLGRVGWNYHMPEILSHEGFSLCAVVDAEKSRLAEAREKADVNCYTDYDEMLSAEKPDLVVIATPTHLHKQHACDALRQGAHVFLDKPMARDLEEAREIYDTAREHGRKLMLYQPHRARPEAVVAKQVIESGILGNTYMIKRAYTGYIRRSDWQALKKYGGGTLFNTGSHFIDQMLYITGDKALAHSCYLSRVATLGDAEDVVKVTLRTRNGVIVDIDLNMATAYNFEPWYLLGKRGGAILTKDDDGNEVFRAKYYLPEDLEEISLSDSLAAKDRKYVSHSPINWRYKDFPIRPEMKIDYYQKCYEYFALDKEPFVPAEDSVYLMEMLQKLAKQGEE
ncbi:MAG: Gfo/Idh/MocA family oxidoreductase [Clostridiales bacterium]|jgi:predicted dehydrogenase|nr:Gfo/Idh/MocA family oxidoreductase [Clostridiales bacterium]